ncbi:MAG: hypothetical protein LYZ70_06725 [Nitrososphaerales archaeon]|nr:hypothetical protein [Nitrososphaerales archaeon]
MSRSSLEEALLGSIETALLMVFDPNTMRAVNFYVDRTIALSNPAEYTRSMQKLFGEGAKVLMDRIIEGVSKGAGLEGGKFASLEECVSSARAKIASRSSV